MQFLLFSLTEFAIHPIAHVLFPSQRKGCEAVKPHLAGLLEDVDQGDGEADVVDVSVAVLGDDG